MVVGGGTEATLGSVQNHPGHYSQTTKIMREKSVVFVFCVIFIFILRLIYKYLHLKKTKKVI